MHGRLEISNRFFIIQPVARRKIQSVPARPPHTPLCYFRARFRVFCHYAGKGNFPAPTAADVFITKRIKLAGQRIGNKTPLEPDPLSLSFSLSRGPKIKYPNICRFNLNHARLQATSFNNETSYCTWQGRIARCLPLSSCSTSSLVVHHRRSPRDFSIPPIARTLHEEGGNFPEKFRKFLDNDRSIDRSILVVENYLRGKKRKRKEDEITAITKLKSSDNFEIIITPGIYPFFEFMECENKL